MYLVFVFRCKKMLIVLSPDFLKSPECDFQTKFAHALSPGKQQEQGISMLILHSALCRLSPTDIDSTCVSNCWQLATQVSACTHPSLQLANHMLTTIGWKWEWGNVTSAHLHKIACKIAVSTAGSACWYNQWRIQDLKKGNPWEFS